MKVYRKFPKPTIHHLAVLVAGLSMTTAACSEDVLRALGTKTDQFVQNAAAMVDILWVVDNSNSMGEEQEGLGESFAGFIDNLVASGVDYHVGVISTDIADQGILNTGGGLEAVITPDTEAPVLTFKQNVKVGVGGSARERGFEAAALALGKGVGWEPCEGQDPPPAGCQDDPVDVPNPGFLRRGYCVSHACDGTGQPCNKDEQCDSASLFLIFVSDEDDKSFGHVEYYWRLFESYLGTGNEAKVKLSAIIGPVEESDKGIPGGCEDPDRGSADPGDRYAELVAKAGGITDYPEDDKDTDNATQGIITSICEDFNESLTSLSIHAAGLSSKFRLSGIPNLNARIPCDPLDAGPFCVHVDGNPVPQNVRTGWSYDAGENAIFFGVDGLPLQQQVITVKYQETR